MFSNVTNPDNINAPIKTNINGELIRIGVGESITTRTDSATVLKDRYPWLIVEEAKEEVKEEAKDKKQLKKKKN